MAEENQNNPAEEQQNQPATNTPKNTPEIVKDGSQKRIRELESKLAEGEEKSKGMLLELETLRKTVAVANKQPLPQNPPKMTVGEYLNNLIFKPKA